MRPVQCRVCGKVKREQLDFLFDKFHIMVHLGKALDTVRKSEYARLSEREGWARRFFDNWRASLEWQRLEPYEKFAEMIDRHWDVIL